VDDRGSVPGRDNDGVSSLRHCVQTGTRVHPGSYQRGPGVNRPSRETDDSPPSSVEVNVWSYASTSQYIFTV